MSLRDLARKALADAGIAVQPAVPPERSLATFHRNGSNLAGTDGTNGTIGTDGTGGTQDTRLVAETMLACAYEERAAILEYEAGLPRSWAEYFARQLVQGPPGDFSPVRWQAAIVGALRFADQWAVEAHRLGWRVEDVFGLHPTAPAARWDCRGLAWLLGDGQRVKAIDSTGADIVTARGGRQKYYRNTKGTRNDSKIA